MVDTPLDRQLTEDARRALYGHLKALGNERHAHEKARKYYEGTEGVPRLIEGADKTHQTIARESVDNIVGPIVDCFKGAIEIGEVRSECAEVTDHVAEIMERSRPEVFFADAKLWTNVHGYSFLAVLPDDREAGGKARVVAYPAAEVAAEYVDWRRDRFPTQAVLTVRVDNEVSTALLVTDTLVYPVEFRGDQMIQTGPAYEHGATFDGKPVCPVVMVQNERSTSEDLPRGEPEKLFYKQNRINAMSYCRSVVGQHGAHKQLIAITEEGVPNKTVARASASSAVSVPLHPDDIEFLQLQETPLAPYTAVIQDEKVGAAMIASAPACVVAGSQSLSNVSTDTAASMEKQFVRRCNEKRELLAGALVTVLRLALQMDGFEDAHDLKVSWADTTIRSFAATVDGIVKLAQMNVPIEDMLFLVPGIESRLDQIIKATVEAKEKAEALAEQERQQKLRDADSFATANTTTGSDA